VLQSFDEITERSLAHAEGGSKCEDFVHLTQLWLGRMQVILVLFIMRLPRDSENIGCVN
jgi:hypothetical protein